MNIWDFDKDVLQHILSFLDLKSLLNLSTTNLKLNSICKRDIIWRNRISIDFPEYYPREKFLNTSKNDYILIYLLLSMKKNIK